MRMHALAAASSARNCPLCVREVVRVRRQPEDRVASVRRYRCRARECRWEGVLAYAPRPAPKKRRRLLEAILVVIVIAIGLAVSISLTAIHVDVPSAAE